MDTTKLDISRDELHSISVVLAFIDNARSGRVSNLQRLEISYKLLEFTAIFRSENGIQAMVNYIQWARDHTESPLSTLDTIFHDIGDRHEPFMSPRSSGYLGYVSRMQEEEEVEDE